MGVRLILIIAAFFVSPAFSAEPVLTGEIPAISDRRENGLMTQGLGTACSVLTGPVGSLPCNPALSLVNDLGDGRKYIVSGRLFIGGEYSRFRTVDRLLHGPYTEDLVQSLFDENQIIDAQLSGSVSFRSRHISASFTPYHLTYFSVVRNQAYPVIALRAAQERTFRVQGATALSESVQAGLQLRFVERQFVQNEFTMFEAIALGQDVLQRKDQNVLYAEPGLAWFGDGTWKPKTSVLLTGLGFANREFEETKPQPVIDFGGAVSPPLGFGELELGLNYRVSDMRPNAWERLGFGADYKLGLIEALLGWGADYVNFGLMSSFWSAHVSILFSSVRFRDADLRDEYRNSLMTEFSFDF